MIQVKLVLNREFSLWEFVDLMGNCFVVDHVSQIVQDLEDSVSRSAELGYNMGLNERELGLGGTSESPLPPLDQLKEIWEGMSPRELLESIFSTGNYIFDSVLSNSKMD